MKNNQHAGLKKETPENDQRCFEMLAAARMVHQDAVVFSATLRDDGEIKISSFTYEGETLLQQRAEVFLKQPNIRRLVVSNEGGTLVSILTDEEDMPPFVHTHGLPIQVDGGTEVDAEEADDSAQKLFEEYCQFVSSRNVRDDYRKAVAHYLDGETLSGPVDYTEAGITYSFDFFDEASGRYYKIFNGEQLSGYHSYLACPKPVTIIVDVEGCQWDQSQLFDRELPLLTLMGESPKQIHESSLLFSYGVLWQMHHRNVDGTLVWCQMMPLAASTCAA